MSLHMLFGLKVKHPSGLRLGHFFNRWDALQSPPPQTHTHLFLKQFKCVYVEKSSERCGKLSPAHSFAALNSLLYALRAPHFRWREWEVIKLINILVIDFNIFAWVIMVCYICLFVCNFRLCIHSGVVGQQLVCTHAQNCSIAS